MKRKAGLLILITLVGIAVCDKNSTLSGSAPTQTNDSENGGATIAIVAPGTFYVNDLGFI